MLVPVNEAFHSGTFVVVCLVEVLIRFASNPYDHY